MGVLKNRSIKYATKKETQEIIKNTIISLFIRVGLLAINKNLNIAENFIEHIDIKIFQDGFDPSTGQEERLLIAKGVKERSFFEKINIKRIEPQAFFKAIAGEYNLK